MEEQAFKVKNHLKYRTVQITLPVSAWRIGPWWSMYGLTVYAVEFQHQLSQFKKSGVTGQCGTCPQCLCLSFVSSSWEVEAVGTCKGSSSTCIHDHLFSMTKSESLKAALYSSDWQIDQLLEYWPSVRPGWRLHDSDIIMYCWLHVCLSCGPYRLVLFSLLKEARFFFCPFHYFKHFQVKTELHILLWYATRIPHMLSYWTKKQLSLRFLWNLQIKSFTPLCSKTLMLLILSMKQHKPCAILYLSCATFPLKLAFALLI